jgi:gliding motility-associated peptidyl-prolyl isomerase
MKIAVKLLALCLLYISLISCQENEARHPVSRKTGTFLKESIERNKKLTAFEEKIIDSLMKSQSELEFIASDKGYWFAYVERNETDTIRPKKGDRVTFVYDVKDLVGNTIYTKEELKTQTYWVDKQNIMMGLRDGIKRMKVGETVTFYFPSHIAYGYHGDKDKIGTNVPLKCTVTLIEIIKENTNL